MEPITICPNFLKCCYTGFRVLHYKFHPWIVVLLAPIKVLASSGVNRTYEKIRCISAMSKIDFASFYGLINDLLW